MILGIEEKVTIDLCLKEKQFFSRKKEKKANSVWNIPLFLFFLSSFNRIDINTKHGMPRFSQENFSEFY